MPSLVAYRISSWDTPFRVSPNRWARRYNRLSRGPVQYWSLNPLTPWAEIIRAHALRTADDVNELRQRVWSARLDLRAIHDIRFDNAATFGIEPYHLVSDDYGGCQELGERLLTDPAMPDAFTVPSAALPGTRNLILFGPRVAMPYDWTPLGPEDSPTAVVAEEALPLEDLLPLVRHFGHDHPEYEAWRKGNVFEFRQPSVLRR